MTLNRGKRVQRNQRFVDVQFKLALAGGKANGCVMPHHLGQRTVVTGGLGHGLTNSPPQPGPRSSRGGAVYVVSLGGRNSDKLKGRSVFPLSGPVAERGLPEGHGADRGGVGAQDPGAQRGRRGKGKCAQDFTFFG